MRSARVTLGILVGVLVVFSSCGDENETFSGIAHTDASGPDLISTDDPEDWQPRCTSTALALCAFPAYPNPAAGHVYAPFRLADSSSVEVYLEESPGRKIRTIGVFPVPSGNALVSWDLLDDKGTTVPNGIYRLWIKATGFQSGLTSMTYGDIQVQRAASSVQSAGRK